MTRILGGIAVIGFLLCACFIGLAAWIGGADFSFPSDFVGVAPVAQSAGTKEWAWSGGDRIELDLPAIVHYEPGAPARVIVHGPKATIDHVKFADGKLVIDHDWFRHDPRIDTILRGMIIRTFAVNGSGKLELGHIDQDALNIHISGSGTARAEGRVDNVDIHVSGAGTAHLGKLAAKNVKIHISGAGKAEIAPSETVDVHISGAGKVTLLTRPKTINTDISGAGRIVQAR